MGPTRNTYPLDSGWKIEGSNDMLHLSYLTVRRITKCLPKRVKPPNAEQAWKAKLQIKNLPFRKVWQATGTYLTSPADERVALKIKHRGLFLRGTNSKAKKTKCRFCHKTKETMDHLPVCPNLEPYRKTVLKLLAAVDCDVANIHPTVTWLLGITWNNDPKTCNPLTELERAILIISWRVLYRHMTLLDLGKTKKIKMKSLQKDLGRTLMSRILAFQQEKRDFYLTNKCAGYRQDTGLLRIQLQEKEVEKVSQLGALNDETGELIVKPTLRKALRSLEAWKRFGRRRGKQSKYAK